MGKPRRAFRARIVRAGFEADEALLLFMERARGLSRAEASLAKKGERDPCEQQARQGLQLMMRKNRPNSQPKHV